MKKSIFTVYVPITSQEQADRLKQVCIDYGLPIWDFEDAFKLEKDCRFFCVDADQLNFAIYGAHHNKIKVEESEFMELLKQWKDENS